MATKVVNNTSKQEQTEIYAHNCHFNVLQAYTARPNIHK